MTQTNSERVWTKDCVLNLIATNDLALARALTVINNNQTAAEQEALQTIERNGKGFNGRDAAVLSDIARKLPRYNNHMTARQRAYVRKALPKYHRQLLQAIEDAGGKVDWGGSKRSQAAANVEAPEGATTEVGQPVQEAPRDQFGAWS